MEGFEIRDGMCLRKSNSRLAGSCLKGLGTPVALLLFYIESLVQTTSQGLVHRNTVSEEYDYRASMFILLSAHETSSEFFSKSLTLFVYRCSAQTYWLRMVSLISHLHW